MNQNQITTQDNYVPLFRPQNRGNKLRVLNDSTTTGRPSIWSAQHHEEDTEVLQINQFVHIGKKRAIVRKKRSQNITVDEDPYNLIQIEEKFDDVEHIDPLKSTLKSRYIQLISKEYMQIIEDVAPFYRSLIALGDLLDEDSLAIEALSDEQRLELQTTTQELSIIVNEYMERLHDIRGLLIKAHLQKRELAQRLNI